MKEKRFKKVVELGDGIGLGIIFLAIFWFGILSGITFFSGNFIEDIPIYLSFIFISIFIFYQLVKEFGGRKVYWKEIKEKKNER